MPRCEMLPQIVVSDQAKLMFKSFTLHEGFTTFGRDKGSEICLEDPSVSRDEGAFSFRHGVLVIEDHNSSVGIFMDGIQIKRRVLYSGDRLTIGPFDIQVKQGTVAPRISGK